MEQVEPQRRTQHERRSRSEDSLMTAAAQLVAERGIERTSLASIGERAGMSRGLPTHHFGSKDALIARLAHDAQDEISEALVAALRRAARGEATRLSGLDLIRLWTSTYLELFEHPSPERRALIVMWGATFPAEASIAGMREADLRNFEGWADHIRTGQRDGSVRLDIAPEPTAVLLTGMIRGVAALLLTDAATTDTSRVRETCQVWITSALAPPERHHDSHTIDADVEIKRAATSR